MARNSYRLARARRAVRDYAEGREDAEEVITDLLTDLRHLADALALDWTKITDLSELHYEEEVGS